MELKNKYIYSEKSYMFRGVQKLLHKFPYLFSDLDDIGHKRYAQNTVDI
jgi:hypothetical protein